MRLIRGGLQLAATVAVVATGLLPDLLDRWEITNWALQLVVVVAVLESISLLVNVGFDIWVDLVHDRRWEMSTQTGRGLAIDQVKSVLLGIAVNVVLLLPLFAVIRSTDLWWLWGWLVVVAFTIGMGFLFPVLIAPVFNTFTPLDDEDMVGRIDRVAELAAVDISGAYVADESRRSRRDNAYVAGLGATRRVVLYDTLLEHPPEVVEQVVAHEVGHWRLGHLQRQIPVMAALLLALFLVLRAVAGWDGLFEWADITTGGDVPAIGQPAALPIIMLVAGAGFSVVGLASAWVSRAFERQADLDALELLGEPDVMLDMQRRLHTKNLADLDPGLLKRLQASHPPAAERMAFTAAWKRSRQSQPS